MGATAAADAEVLSQLIERATEARRGLEAPEALHRVVALLHRSVTLLGVVVEVLRRAMPSLAADDPADRPSVSGVQVGRDPCGLAFGDLDLNRPGNVGGSSP